MALQVLKVADLETQAYSLNTHENYKFTLRKPK